MAKETLSVSAGGEDEEEWVRDLPPLTRSLLGIAAGDAGEEDYEEYLWQKYGPFPDTSVTVILREAPRKPSRYRVLWRRPKDLA
jgi:hypothetical protein